MRIIIAGAGAVGLSLARYLRAEENEIVLIDENAANLGNLSEQLDIQTIQGSASHPAILKRAGADHADIFLAMTGNDEANIVSCSVAKFVFNIPKRIARITSIEYLAAAYRSFLHSLSIDVVISPEVETANRIFDCLSISGSVETFTLGEGAVKLVGLKCQRNTPAVGKTVEALQAFIGDLGVGIFALERRSQLVAPDGAVVKAGDNLYCLVDTAQLPRFLEKIEHIHFSPRYILIYGGGKIGFHLAKILEEDKIAHDVTLIEKDEARARFLAEKLDATLVIHGDALDVSLIEELNLQNYKISIATTHSDENNLLLSLVSKRHGIERTCALLHNELYDKLLSGLGVDTTLDSNAVMVSATLQHLRKERVKNDYFLQSGLGEVLEISAGDKAAISKGPLGKIKLPPGVVIGGVLRGDLFIRPQKDLIIRPKDTVFVFVERGKMSEAEKLFATKLSFF